ncbi:MAG TPA: ABC transporter ATP-binding protein [Candidatus Limnocylindrales bacterium]|nr:ABC transporter ATP-binding protein [Candidatus Limnocylindrales bacterium]
MAEIRVQNVHKFYDRVHAVRDVSLTVADREFLVLLGPSGCGKTTLLRCIAGLERVDAGSIRIGDRDVTELPPRRRRIAMVFQSYAVFPHMTVFENIAFGLRMQKRPAAEVRRRVQEAAELLHIENLLERHPAAASGGQRQRIAVARAIAVGPEVLLMDEPLSNLDALLRLEMRAELKRLLSELKTTTVYVTHDQVEALSMGDRIAVMRDGVIVQDDRPLAIYDRPVDRFVGGFIGNPPMNFLDAEVERTDGRLRVRLPGGTVELAAPADGGLGADAPPGRLILGVRAENLELARQSRPDAVEGEVLVVEPLGSHNLLTVAVGEERIKAVTRADETATPGEHVWMVLPPEKLWWLDRETGRALAAEPPAAPA